METTLGCIYIINNYGGANMTYTSVYNISDGVDAGIDFGVAFIVKLAERSPDIADIVVFTLVIGLLFGAVFVILDLPGKIKSKFAA